MTRKYKIIKPINIGTLYKAGACTEGLEEFLRIYGRTTFVEPKFSAAPGPESYDILEDYLDWLEAKEFIKRVDKTYPFGSYFTSNYCLDPYILTLLPESKATLINIGTGNVVARPILVHSEDFITEEELDKIVSVFIVKQVSKEEMLRLLEGQLWKR